jgi:hypothetical protein
MRSLFLIACLLPTLALAQDQPKDTPNRDKDSGAHFTRSKKMVPAAKSPFFRPMGLFLKAHVGPTFTNFEMPSTGRLALGGVNGGITGDISPFFGLTTDVSYSRTLDAQPGQSHANVFSYLAGPELYPYSNKKFTLFVHTLVGGAKVSGLNLSPPIGAVGFTNRFSAIVGGGIQFNLTREFSFQTGWDYQYTQFVNPAVAIRGQNNARVVCSLVYGFWASKNWRRNLL